MANDVACRVPWRRGHRVAPLLRTRPTYSDDVGYPVGYPGHCRRCGALREHSETYDAAFCRPDDEWQTPTCRNGCKVCESRPARPSDADDLALGTLEPHADYDLDLDDVAEVRRRVVDPVVKGLFADREIASVDIFKEVASRPPWDHWPLDLSVPMDVFCRVTFFNAEQAQVWLGYQGHFDAEAVASRLAEQLEDEFTESRWGWAQRRVAEYRVLPARR